MAEQVRFSFKTVHLLKDQCLGIGSYGAVCKAKCDDLVCAAKMIHATLFDPSVSHQMRPQREHRLPIRRFEQECDFMSGMRHPNIVQYLGMYRDSADTHLPVLLMELMDDSLTHFLESSSQPIPYHIAVNICHDVTLALSFLHSNKIVHRDLSSNNVLLRNTVLAKVTDFGMARLGDINPHATRYTSTMCPGTDVYMPPEAVQDKPVYTEKIDCFSFGVITLQILTRLFPKPGDRMQEVELSHPGLGAGRLLMQIPEVSRRQSHISQVDPDHLLLPIIFDCIKDKDNERPSAHQLCERVADLKRKENYIKNARDKEEVIQSLESRVHEKDQTILSKEEESQQLRQQLQLTLEEKEENARHKDEIIQSLVSRVQEKDQIILSKEEENQQLRKQLQLTLEERENIIHNKVQSLIEKGKQLTEKDEQLEELRQEHRKELVKRDRQFGIVNQQLQEVEQVIGQSERRVAELEQLLGQRDQQLQEAQQVVGQFKRKVADLEQQLSQREQQSLEGGNGRKELASIKFKWIKRKKAPSGMSRLCDAVVDGNTVYIRDGGTVKICSYDATSDSWTQLPNPDYSSGDGSITVINGWLTTVGGFSSNELFSLIRIGESDSRRWTKRFPPMPTKRWRTTSLCTVTTLIVAGGRGEGGVVLSTVEVMNIRNHQWSTAANLLRPICIASATICGDCMYMLGGVDEHSAFTKSVYTCSVSALLQSCVPNSAKVKRSSSSYKASVWRQVADLPATHCTCDFFHGRLLAVGGADDSSSRKATTAVYVYSSTSNTWEVISHMTTGRYSCFTAVLPNNQLMVVGGETSGWTYTDTVEVASVVM